jgi:hypothetical protein
MCAGSVRCVRATLCCAYGTTTCVYKLTNFIAMLVTIGLVAGALVAMQDTQNTSAELQRYLLRGAARGVNDVMSRSALAAHIAQATELVHDAIPSIGGNSTDPSFS